MLELPPGRPPLVGRDMFDIMPSCLGFGCASLGSRVGARAGLRALAEAHEAGITWFDVAPVYGAGSAETILAEFLKGRRDSLVLTTKVGLAPPARLAAIKTVYALGRPVVGALGGLRRAFRRAAGTRNRALALDGALIERSITASLARLGTDRVDVLALHDPAPDDVTRDDVLRALERTVARGQARKVAVAGEAAACAAAARLDAPYTLLQMSTAARRDMGDGGNSQFQVLHSVLGVAGDRDRLMSALAADPTKPKTLSAHGYAPATAATDLLLDAAFAANRDGIVLLSMFRPAHLAMAMARAASPNPEAPRLLQQMLA